MLITSSLMCALCVHTHSHVDVCMWMCVCARVCVRARACACVCTCVHASVCMHMCMCIYICMHVCGSVCVVHLHTCELSCVHTVMYIVTYNNYILMPIPHITLGNLSGPVSMQSNSVTLISES